jgi:hypothetical protein
MGQGQGQGQGQDQDQDQRMGIKKIKGKNNTLLIAQSPLAFNLTLGLPTFWSRMLGDTPLFRIPKSEDAGFDRQFVITAYRDDVLRAIQSNAEFRRALIQLSNDVKGFSSLCYAKGKVTMAIAAGPYACQIPIEAARDTLASAFPNLCAPFETLPADAAQETRAHVIDWWASLASVMTMLFLAVIGVDAPLASGELPWGIILQGCALYFAFHIALLFVFSDHVQQGSQVEITEMIGALGLTYVALVKRL